jgi:hypothetical protein
VDFAGQLGEIGGEDGRSDDDLIRSHWQRTSNAERRTSNLEFRGSHSYLIGRSTLGVRRLRPSPYIL